MENRGFNQIKTFLWQITPKNKLHHFSEKIFLVLGALIYSGTEYCVIENLFLDCNVFR